MTSIINVLMVIRVNYTKFNAHPGGLWPGREIEMICPGCDEDKRRSEFHQGARECRECVSFRSREWYEANKEKKKKQARQRRQDLRNRRPPPLPESKVCRRCGVEKAASDFDATSQVSDGLKSYCRECNIALLKEKAAERKAAAVVAGSKRCSKCGLRKPASEFVKNWRSADGLYSQCKQCKN